MHSQITYNRIILQEKYWIVARFRKFLFRKFVPEKREEANIDMKNQWRYLFGLQLCCMSPNRHWNDFFFLRIVEDTVCLFLAFLVDMKKIWLCCLLADITEFLLVDLSGLVERWIWFLLADLTEVLLAEIYRVELPIPLAVPILLLWIFGLNFSTNLASLRSSYLLSAGGEATNS